MVVQRGHLEGPRRNNFAHHRVDLGFRQDKVAHHHRSCPPSARTPPHAAQSEAGFELDPVKADLEIAPGQPVAMDVARDRGLCEVRIDRGPRTSLFRRLLTVKANAKQETMPISRSLYACPFSLRKQQVLRGRGNFPRGRRSRQGSAKTLGTPSGQPSVRGAWPVIWKRHHIGDGPPDHQRR